MTTDTVPKAASRARCRSAAGRSPSPASARAPGMIRPNMATMLGFVATDAAIAPALVQQLVREAADESFNRITIDGDTSTNDSFVLIATARRQRADHELDSADGRGPARRGVRRLARSLAQAIVRDGEGATKFITVRVEGGASVEECRKVAYAIAHSPLVKTAFFASDPNLGRILAAVGYAGIDDLDQTRIDLFLDDVHVVEGGGRRPSYREEDGQRVMKQSEITVRVGLHRGAARRHDLDLRPELRLRQDQRRLPELTPERLRPHHGAQQQAAPAAATRCFRVWPLRPPRAVEHRLVGRSRRAWPRRSSRAPPTRPAPA